MFFTTRASTKTGFTFWPKFLLLSCWIPHCIMDWAPIRSAMFAMATGVRCRFSVLFGSGYASAAALLAETRLGPRVSAVVSRGGRPDLVRRILGEVQAPTLLLVGAADAPVLELNRQACTALRCVKRIELVPRASHLFQEAGALDAVAKAAAEWFCSHLQPAHGPR